MSRNHRHTAWAWLKAEIARQLGEDAADRLWAEYAKKAHDDKRTNDRVDAPEIIKRLEWRMERADGAEQRRLVKRIARLKELLAEGD
jgi:hypothetical protein